jgi:hypothetical protein
LIPVKLEKGDRAENCRSPFSLLPDPATSPASEE